MCSVHKESISRGTAMVISFSGAVSGLVGKTQNLNAVQVGHG